MRIDPNDTFTGAAVQKIIDELSKQFGTHINALREQRNTALNDLAYTQSQLAQSKQLLQDEADARVSALQRGGELQVQLQMLDAKLHKATSVLASHGIDLESALAEDDDEGDDYPEDED